MEFGLLLIRIAVGLTLAAHGAQKLFGWFGGYGLAGTGGWMESIGFRPGRRHAEMAGTAEFLGGLLFALGCLTPLAAAAIIGVMATAAIVVHRPNGFFVTAGGFEFTFVLAAVAAGVAFTGPGAASVDAALRLPLDGALWGAIAVALGLTGAAIQIASRNVATAEPDVDLVEAEAEAVEPEGQAVTRIEAESSTSSTQRTQSRPSPFAR